VLRGVAGILEKSVRPYDKVGRYGGDELMVVLPNCSLYQVSKIAERIRAAGAGLKVKSGRRPLGISLSIGCTSSECFLQPESNGLLLASDKALYEAKRGGRNRVAVSDAVEGAPVLPALKERNRGR
jgi:two-component system cell cycle response regulator